MGKTPPAPLVERVEKHLGHSLTGEYRELVVALALALNERPSK